MDRKKKEDSNAGSQRRKHLSRYMKKIWVRKAAAVCLVLVLTLSPCASLFCGSILTQAAQFSIEKMNPRSMIEDEKFDFFDSYTWVEIYYWMKNDGCPLMCIQKSAQLTDGLDGREDPEKYLANIHFNKFQYERVSIVLQCCGMQRNKEGVLKPGEYLAAQAAIWGILTPKWRGTNQLRQEMQNLHTHVVDWNGWRADQIVAQSEVMTEVICQALDDYYGDSSKYIPAFASKYESSAPVWQAQWMEDGSCQVVFELKNRSEAVKDFQFQLPKGWTYSWKGDQVFFQCQNPETGLISVTGRAPEGSELGKAMPIGLIYVVKPSNYENLQHLASGVEINVPWSCYFTISVPENTGSWSLPGVNVYRHQEDFTALYGVCLEKTDGDTKELLEGVKFQPLEYFDDRQLEGTILDPKQMENWDGWMARCEEETTGQEGRLTHLDQKNYHFEKTYCGGHPDPVIDYEGKTTAVREQLEAEAWEEWEEAVESCQQLCDYHSLDGSGAALLEAERDLAYEQFIHLVYGYTFKETQPLEGYLPHGESPKDKAIRKVFCESLQAGGKEAKQGIEGRKLSWSPNKAERVMAAASQSNADYVKIQETKETLEEDSSGQTALEMEQESFGLKAESPIKTASSSEGIKKMFRAARTVWLTSQIEPLMQEMPENVEELDMVCLVVENHKPEEPKETTPEETTPEETPPEETTPEETSPEETTPEETSPEETAPEETSPEETPPEESTPEETPPEESTPEETLPKETTPKETPPEEATPEETPPEETIPKETPSEETTQEGTLPEETPPEETSPEETQLSKVPDGNGGGRKPPDLPKISEPPETVSILSLPEPPPLRIGWIDARYALTPLAGIDDENIPGSGRRKRQSMTENGLPKTGDMGISGLYLFLVFIGSGLFSRWIVRKRMNEERTDGNGEMRT